MNVNKAAKEMLRDEFRKVWRRRDGSIDEKMVTYCVNKASAYMVLDDTIVTFDKPSIETRFCFGYGMQSAYDYDEALDAASAASESESYFIHKNLDGTSFAWYMKAIAGDEWWLEPWLDPVHYTCQTKDCRIGEIRWEHWHKRDWCRSQGWRPLTDDELVELYGVCYEEQVKFLKRLKTYLKRYGMSKVQTWTYWADE